VSGDVKATRCPCEEKTAENATHTLLFCPACESAWSKSAEVDDATDGREGP
jgi:predicted metal-binding protein